MIRKCPDKIHWDIVSEYQSFSIDFTLDFKEKIDWFSFSLNENITEEIIQKFTDYVEWEEVSKRQNLTNLFVTENKDKVHWNRYFVYQKADFEMYKKFITKTTYKKVEEFKNAHLSRLQKQEIQKILDLKYLFEA